jgi:hypothetical protein
MTGNWRGTIGEDSIDESWSSPAGNTLMGMFRWLSGDQVSLYEFMLIEALEDTLRLKIKHFNPDFTGWEAKDQSTTFALISLAEHEVVFEKHDQRRLTYRRSGDALTCTMLVYKPDGTLETHPFLYRLPAKSMGGASNDHPPMVGAKP